MSKPKITPAIDLLLPSIEIIRQNLLTYFVLSVIPLLLLTYSTKGSVTLSNYSSPLTLVASILSLAFFAPLIYTITQTSAGKPVNLITALKNGYRYFFRLLGLSIVFGFLLIGGLILLIIPGIIVLRRYYLSFYYLVDKDLSIKEAMQASAKSSAKNSGAIYGIIGLNLLFSVFGLIPGLGNVIGIILQFLYSVSPGLRYHEMKKL